MVHAIQPVRALVKVVATPLVLVVAEVQSTLVKPNKTSGGQLDF